MPRKFRPPQIPDFARTAKRIIERANELLVEAVEAYAGDERDEFVYRIERQAFASFQEPHYPESEELGNPNLSYDYLARKLARLDEVRTLIATGHYIDSIKVFRKKLDDRRNGYEIRVGFHPSARARDMEGRTQPVTLNKVAIYLEFGSLDGKLPARPAWQPHLSRMRARAGVTRKRIGRRIRKTLAKDRQIKAVVTYRA